MKKILLTLLAAIAILPALIGQRYDYKRPAALGISFVLNDYSTPQYIRSNSLTATFRDKKWASTLLYTASSSTIKIDIGS